MKIPSALKGLLAACLAPVLLTALATPASAQNLYSDKASYEPGEIALLVGTGFTPGETVTLRVLNADLPITDPVESDSAEHQPWSAVADARGNVLSYWVVCEDACCAGALLRARADGLSSADEGETFFTDEAVGCTGGTVTVTTPNGSCLDFTPAAGGGPDNWEVAEGGNYTMTISGVTECTGDTITVFVQNSQTGNWCFNAVGGSGTYVGTFTMPNPACFTSPIKYKCGANAPCNNQGAITARGPSGACSVHLRANIFDANCENPVADDDCEGSCVCDGPPVLDTCAGCLKENLPCNFYVDLGCNPPFVPDYVEGSVTASDNCGPVVVTGGSAETSFGCLHLRRVDYRAENDCGVTACVVVYAWIVDTTAPVIDCPENLSLDCSAPTEPANTGSATATDDCGKTDIGYSDSVTEGNCPGNRVIARLWTATDSCGNTSTCVQTLSISDTTGPVLTCPPDVSLGCGASTDPGSTGWATATDDCSGASTPTYNDTVGNGGNCANSYVITRTWSSTDGCGNPSSCVQTITVADTTPPTITCPPDVTVTAGDVCCLALDIGTATASDGCGNVVVGSDAPAEFCVGTTTVTWTATDDCGNTSTCTQKVNVLGRICASKFYDANADGIRNNGEVGVAGWRMQVSGTTSNGNAFSTSGFTGADGSVCFDVPAGTYVVAEGTPTQTNWVHTTPASSSVTVNAGDCSGSVEFGNYCFHGPSGGKTLGFWSNNNGRAILQANDPAWRHLLNALNLRKANGTDFVVPTTGSFTTAYGVFRTWILGATATNMSYMLSAQLAAATLADNYHTLDSTGSVVVPGGVKTGGNVCIVPFLSVVKPISCGSPPLLTLTGVPGSTSCNCTSNNGLVLISDLLARADCLLGAYPTMSTASTQRTYAECVKNIIDMINNNGNNGYACGGITQVINPGSGSCPATFP